MKTILCRVVLHHRILFSRILPPQCAYKSSSKFSAGKVNGFTIKTITRLLLLYKKVIVTFNISVTSSFYYICIDDILAVSSCQKRENVLFMWIIQHVFITIVEMSLENTCQRGICHEFIQKR